jgi:hypothetical protein
MANVKVRCNKNTQIFYNDKGLFKVFVFFSGQEYEIDEMVYKMKPDVFELLTTEEVNENFEPRTTTEESFEPGTEKVEVQFEPREHVEENLEPKVTTEELVKPEVEEVETQLEPSEHVEETFEPRTTTEESVEQDVSNSETPSEPNTVEVSEEKQEQDEQQTTSKRKRKSSKQ